MSIDQTAFREWCKLRLWDVDRLTTQERKFLEAGYEAEMRNPKYSDGPATAQNRIESGAK